MTRISILALCLALAGPAYAGDGHYGPHGGPDCEPGDISHGEPPSPEPERPEPTKAERPDREGCQWDRCPAAFGSEAARVTRTGMDR